MSRATLEAWALDHPEKLVEFAEAHGVSIGDPDDRGSLLLSRLLRLALGFRYHAV